MTATVTDLGPVLRESIEARISEMRGRVSAKLADADLLMEESDATRCEAIRLEHEADLLADKLRGMS